MSVTRMPTTIDACRQMLTYSRESAERLLGVYGQDSEIADWAEYNGWEIVGSARDNQIHGQLPAMERPGLSAAIKAVEDGKVGGVIVQRWDRLARDFQTQDDAVQRIWRAGGRFFTVDPDREWKPDKPWDPDWRARRDYAEEAERELRALINRLESGRRAKMARGGYGGGPRFGRKYGYELVYDFPAPGHRDYRPIPEEQVVIRWVCAEHESGRSFGDIARDLNEQGVPTVKDKGWTRKTVRSLVLRGPARLIQAPSEDELREPLQWVRASSA